MINLHLIGDLIELFNFSWKNPMGTGTARKNGPREHVDIQESLPLGSRMLHPDEQELGQRGQDE